MGRGLPSVGPVWRLWYWINRTFFGAWFGTQFRVRIEGREHEPPPPYILLVNHVSAVDPPLTAVAVRARLIYMAKRELSHHPISRAWVGSLGFFVNRGEADRSAVRTALAVLEGGRSLCLFAEGTRSLDGRLQPLETGAAYLALRSGVPVLPLAIIGSHRVMPKGARFPRSGRVILRLGPPVAVPRVEGRLPRALIQEWTTRFHRALRDLLPPDQQPLASPTEPVQAGLAKE